MYVYYGFYLFVLFPSTCLHFVTLLLVLRRYEHLLSLYFYFNIAYNIVTGLIMFVDNHHFFYTFTHVRI